MPRRLRQSKRRRPDPFMDMIRDLALGAGPWSIEDDGSIRWWHGEPDAFADEEEAEEYFREHADQFDETSWAHFRFGQCLDAREATAAWWEQSDREDEEWWTAFNAGGDVLLAYYGDPDEPAAAQLGTGTQLGQITTS